MLWILLIWLNQCLAVSSLPKLIVASFDGFRNDYVNVKSTPNLVRLREKGSSAPYMINVFPTQTFTNHFSIATGLYPEVHGVLGSHMFNPINKKVLNYSNLWSYNEHIVPLWSLNEKEGNGRHSGTIMWPGGEFDFDGIKTTFVWPFNQTIPWEERIDRLINWFKDPSTPINVGFVYFEQPDYLSHVFGPNSNATRSEIGRVDSIVDYLFEQIKSNGLTDEVNVVLLSDHGFSGVYLKNVIDVKSVCSNDCDIYGTSPVRQIMPKNINDIDLIYNKLKKLSVEKKSFDVYKKSEIPDRLHIKNCNLTLPILVVARMGYAFEDLYDYVEEYKTIYSNVSDGQEFGVHGYDPDEVEMRPFFIAVGPSFKSNLTIDPFRNIDLYPMFAKILNLDFDSIDIKPNGTLNDQLKYILKDSFSYKTSFIIVSSISLMFGTVAGLLICVAKYMNRSKKNKILGSLGKDKRQSPGSLVWKRR